MRFYRLIGRPVTAAVLVMLGVLVARAPAGAAEPLRFGKGFPSLFQFTPIDVGVAEGIFRKHGLDIEISAFAGDAKLQQAFAAGAVDIGVGSGPGMAFIAKGSPILGIAEEAGPPLGITLCVLASSPIHGLADLKDKLASISSIGSQTDWMVRELARRQGWGPEGIKRVALGDVPAQLSALRTHQIDMVPFDITTAYQLNETGEIRILLKFGDVVKEYVNHVIFASNDMISKHPNDVKKFLAAWFETIAFFKHNKADVVRISSGALKIAEPIVSKVYDETLPMLSDDGRFDPKGLAVLAQSFVDMNTLPEKPDMPKLYTEKFLPGAP